MTSTNTTTGGSSASGGGGTLPNPLSNSGGWKNSIKPNQYSTNHQTLLSPSRKQSMLKKPFEILSSVSSNYNTDDETSDCDDNSDITSKKSVQNNNHIDFSRIIDESNKNNNNNVNSNQCSNSSSNSNNTSPNINGSGRDTFKLSKQNSLKNFDNLTQDQEILVKIWLPMEYTGTLYKVRKFSGGKSTMEILNILNSQLAPFYQSPKNKLFLNNEDKPIPPHVTLKKLNLSKTDVIYIRREPEYEISAPGYPNKGTLVLDKDIKVVEILQKIELWLFDKVDDGRPHANSSGSNGVQADYTTDIIDEVHKEHDDNGFVSNYNLLKKLSLPNSRKSSKLNRGYYLRLFDQKQLNNYGIKIKDTLIFKKKVLNRGLGVDDAEGGIELLVVYSPLSMYPTPSELNINHDSEEQQQSSNTSTPPISPNLKSGMENLNLQNVGGNEKSPNSMTSVGGGFNNIIATSMIKIEKPLLINDPNEDSSDTGNGTAGSISVKKDKGKKKTLSGVGLPFNVQHKTHVDYEYKWTGANVEESFEFKEKLGQGGYGAVFRVSHKETGFNLAVKVLSVTPTRLKDIEKEMDLLKKCRCPNVLSYYGSISKLTELWILMDYCAVGSIKDMMKTCCDTLDEDQISAVTLNVLGGLGYLHSKGIVHLDVKAANILLTEDKQIKMADFGVSQQLQTPYGHSNVLIGSPLYMAPELILKAPFSAKADVWSLGITLIELAEGRPPGRGLKNMNQLLEIPNMAPPKLSNPKDWSPSFNDFLSKCLTKDPEQRPSVSELLSHPFMQSAKTTECLNAMMKQCLSIKEAQIKEFEENLNSHPEP
ncbi:putative protein serine/threonine kinase [Tieghemostelium lacteum]|uniref:non-specific serine/threonine protein kinase n=1 Tax=Tieghemostelium lacteum TaxID=361077 RepID=A0A152A6I4_TIELA|nr:putative protein serine/threonine kinase [Tieghemostelium lacteum]|eukprot:KYR01844.1 putative protein serine/threonine kinase [Tieghemostelium lacteum]